jgi:hypothetical protein
MDQKMRLQEMQHRMANSLPSVPGLFRLAARGFQLLRLPRLLLGDRTDHSGGNCALNLTSEWLSYSVRSSFFNSLPSFIPPAALIPSIVN